MKLKYLINLFIASISLIACNESLEDTYGDYAGDGRIRYVGKCSGLDATPGWYRLSLKWMNSIDATIDSIRVTWTASSDVIRDTLLNATDTTLILDNLQDGTYRIGLQSVDKRGEKSLEITTYARPYTENHEIVKTFTQAITKFYRVGNNLVFFTDKWNDDIVDLNLHYTGTDREEKIYELTKERMNEGFLTVENVDMGEPITVSRVGRITGTSDTIQFNSLTLENKRTLTSDFMSAIQCRYGFSTATSVLETEFNHFLDTVRVLEFDYNLNTLEDILYCPKLEKIVLGKNRYLVERFTTKENYSVLYDEARSLKVLNEANRLMGVKVERYANHYLTGKPDYVEDKGFQTWDIPDNLVYIPSTDVDTVACDIKDINADPYLPDLVDNDPETRWETSPLTFVRTYELTITLKELKRIRGIKIGQKLFDPTLDRDSKLYLPPSIIVKTSADKIDWDNVTYVEENTLGQGSGEVTLLPIAEGSRDVKYIRVILNDQVSGSTCRIMLADIIPYE
ncbi:DUF4998 domain-containing protein [Butyricimonas faecihominis]|uniref:DUF4998 domain-containing protein n=1 Tax=Butyricimonas faecihominis TaxID=1472416 RepID=UPI00095F5553|nr:MAG: hypothetical protein BHV81_07525 [Butyricimonas synergistica]